MGVGQRFELVIMCWDFHATAHGMIYTLFAAGFPLTFWFCLPEDQELTAIPSPSFTTNTVGFQVVVISKVISSQQSAIIR